MTVPRDNRRVKRLVSRVERKRNPGSGQLGGGAVPDFATLNPDYGVFRSAPVADGCLNDGERGHRRRVGAQNARTEWYSRRTRPAHEHGPLLLRKSSLRADQDGKFCASFTGGAEL